MNNDGLPEGWAEVALGAVTEQVPNVKPESQPTKEFCYIDISSINKQLSRVEPERLRRFPGSDAPSRARRPVRPGDIVFSNVRTNLRNIAIVEKDLGADICSTGFTVLRAGPAVLPRYILRWVLTDRFTEAITETQTGTHYPATSDGEVLRQHIRLAPLGEQRRIVAKVEDLLEQVSRARDRLAKLPLIFKRFRQAVLGAACSGKLTEERRATQDSGDSTWPGAAPDAVPDNVNEPPRQWSLRRLDDISERVSVGHVGPTTEYYCEPSKGVPFVRSQNVRPMRLVMDEVQSITREFHNSLRKSQLHSGDLLVVRVGANRGDVCIVPTGLGELNCANIVFARPLPGLSTWLELYCNSPEGQKQLQDMTTGSAQGVLNTTAVAGLVVPLPPPPEQAEIIRRVGILLAFTAEIERRIKAATVLVGKLPQVILSKAFSGELVPTEAELAHAEGREYESASALLARLGKAVAGNPTKPKRAKARDVRSRA